MIRFCRNPRNPSAKRAYILAFDSKPMGPGRIYGSGFWGARTYHFPVSDLRVLMICYEFPPLGGGTGNACRHLLGAFSLDETLHVDLVTSGTGSGIEVERLGARTRIHRLPVDKGSPHFWSKSELLQWTRRAWRFARGHARTHRFDLCHCWSGWPSGLIGYSLKGGMPYLIALRGSDVPGFNPRLRWLDPAFFKHLSRRVWRRAAAVTAVSRHLEQLARRTEGVVPIEVIENGIDTSYFSPATVDGSDSFSILFVGRLIDRKAVDVLIGAFGELDRQENHCRLTILGDGPERGRLEQLCREHDVADRVEFRGAVPTEEVRDAYRQAQLFVTPAVEEGHSNAMLEAMASGLPIVATPAAGGELIRDNGTIVDPGCRQALRSAIASYRRDPDLRRRHGAASRRMAESMTWESTARAYRELYDRIAAR